MHVRDTKDKIKMRVQTPVLPETTFYFVSSKCVNLIRFFEKPIIEFQLNKQRSYIILLLLFFERGI
jgi:hypothetical protein